MPPLEDVVDLPAENMDIAELYAWTYPAIYRFVRARMHDPHDAEDVTSQTFLQAVRAYDSARTPAEVMSWLFQIARNVMGDHWRRYYRSAPTVALTDVIIETTAEGGSQETPENPVAAETLEVTLSALPERYRKVLELRFLQGASLQETAEALRITVANAKVLQHRALRRASSLELEIDREAGLTTYEAAA
jgi:RNA polymerase sigma factor (sigma-70 family)